MRIGIHTGTVYGAIIGTDVIRYDIFGNDVLIANKMESNGITGKIVVSETTKSILDESFNHNFLFSEHKTVRVGNENIMSFTAEYV